MSISRQTVLKGTRKLIFSLCHCCPLHLLRRVAIDITLGANRFSKPVEMAALATRPPGVDNRYDAHRHPPPPPAVGTRGEAPLQNAKKASDGSKKEAPPTPPLVIRDDQRKMAYTRTKFLGEVSVGAKPTSCLVDKILVPGRICTRLRGA